MTDKSTAELVELARTRGAPAFGELVERFQDMVVGYALARLRDPDRALDVAQEAFTDAYLHLDQLREPAAFPGWLRTIVHKHCDRQTRRYEPAVVPQPDDVAAQRSLPDELLDAARDSAWLRTAIESLPEHERLVVALHYLGDTAQRDVAGFLELPLTTVKKRLFSARTRIRDWRTKLDSNRIDAMRPSRTRTFADRIQLFLAIRSADQQTVGEILTRDPELIDAEEVWRDDEALQGGFPLSHRLTPLILAASQRDPELVELLLTRGASLDGRCGCANGETALWASVRAGCEETANVLLTAGANPNATNARGHTPLHVAAMRGRADLVQLLVGYGADATRTASNAMTAEDWAKTHGHFEVVEALTGQPAREIPCRPSTNGEAFETGIKAVDLFTPIRKRDVVRIHGAAETGLIVLVTELSRRISDAGGTSVWVGWEARPWQLGELDTVAAEAGIGSAVHIVKARQDDIGSQNTVIDRAMEAATDVRRSHARVALFVFEEEGHAAEVEAALPRLADRADVVFVVRPWIAVTRGELPIPELTAPYDAAICTDSALANDAIYPAIHPVHSKVRAADAQSPRHLRISQDVRDMLAAHRDEQFSSDSVAAKRAELVRAFLSQPFLVTEHQTGWKGESVPVEKTLDDLERILGGELDDVPEQVLRYRGDLPDDLNGLTPRLPEWT